MSKRMLSGFMSLCVHENTSQRVQEREGNKDGLADGSVSMEVLQCCDDLQCPLLHTPLQSLHPVIHLWEDGNPFLSPPSLLFFLTKLLFPGEF